MQKDKIIIIGASGHAKVVSEIIELNGRFEIVGFFDFVNKKLEGLSFCGSKIYTNEKDIDTFKQNNVKYAFVGFGNCKGRRKFGEELIKAGFTLPTLIHPSAIVSKSAIIGCGSLLTAGSIVNPDCKIGNHVIINTNASVDHDCIINDAVHICPRVALAGNVQIEEESWIGIGSVVIEKIIIGKNCLIGGGAVVIRNVPDNSKMVGVPAKSI